MKVRRPGIEAALRADLALLDLLRPPLASLLPETDTAALLAAIRERALDELDLLHEAEQERAAGRVLRQTAGVETPVVHLDLATPAVKVTSWLEGPTLDGRAPGRPARRRAGAPRRPRGRRPRRARAHRRPAQPRRAAARGRASGCSAPAARWPSTGERVARQIALVTALRDRDEAAFAAAATGLGLPERRRRHADPRRRRAAARRARAARRSGARRRRRRRARAAARRSSRSLRLEPQDVWLARGTGQLVAVLARLGAREDWRAAARDPATASRGAGTARAGRRGPRP